MPPNCKIVIYSNNKVSENVDIINSFLLVV